MHPDKKIILPASKRITLAKRLSQLYKDLSSLYTILYSHIIIFLRPKPSDPPNLTIRPNNICLEASPLCQLRCPSCPTAKGEIRKSIVGADLLAFDNFKKIIDENPQIKSIELSNWGEIFLNPSLLDMMKYAYEKNVMLTATNGTNFNHVPKDVLEGLVKYRFSSITCSIDGATQETYVKYRVGGDFDNVIGNIQSLNELKRQYQSPYPELSWQFIMFEHNKHELPAAQALAKELNMRFFTKISWDKKLAAKAEPNSSMEADLIKTIEQLQNEESDKLKTICDQLWIWPQINSNGRVLGCCVNFWGDFGNAFETPDLYNLLNNQRMQYARQMLSGLLPAQKGIPCSDCCHYKKILKRRNWITKKYTENYLYPFDISWHRWKNPNRSPGAV